MQLSFFGPLLYSGARGREAEVAASGIKIVSPNYVDLLEGYVVENGVTTIPSPRPSQFAIDLAANGLQIIGYTLERGYTFTSGTLDSLGFPKFNELEVIDVLARQVRPLNARRRTTREVSSPWTGMQNLPLFRSL
eukprot:1706054-Pleurochrysis_carterae.AAC.1